MDVLYYQAKNYMAEKPCWLLVYDVLVSECGITQIVCKTVTGSIRAAASAFRVELAKGSHGFEQVEEPADFTVVLMGKSDKVGIHHAGIYYGGKVLHACPNGTLHQDLSSLGDEYRLMEFWRRAE